MNALRASSRMLGIAQKSTQSSLRRAASTAVKAEHQPNVDSSRLHALKVISPDSGMPMTISPLFNPNMVGRVPPEPNRPEIKIPTDRGCFADPEKKALFSVAKPQDLTISVGTELKGCQLSQLTNQQLDELALLIAERGVVFLRDQDITADQQVKMFEYFGMLKAIFNPCPEAHMLKSLQGPLEKHPGQKVRIAGSRDVESRDIY
jgi:sulfonate dioxygenase